jgi:hypothetical protein
MKLVSLILLCCSSLALAQKIDVLSLAAAAPITMKFNLVLDKDFRVDPAHSGWAIENQTKTGSCLALKHPKELCRVVLASGTGAVTTTYTFKEPGRYLVRIFATDTSGGPGNAVQKMKLSAIEIPERYKLTEDLETKEEF